MSNERIFEALQNKDFVLDWANLHDEIVYSEEFCNKLLKMMQNSLTATNNILPLINKLAHVYFEGAKVKQNIKLAFDLWVQAANKGHTPAMEALAYLYDIGENCKQDTKLAIEWNEKAASIGSITAMINLGSIYMKTLKDTNLAIFWYTKAAELNNVFAMITLSSIYCENGALQDYNLVKKWLVKASELGSKRALYELGGLYLFPNYPDHDIKLAFQYLTESDEHYANNDLGWFYSSGYNVPVDREKAFELFTKAISQGSIQAMENLGDMYNNPLFAKYDEELAISWYTKAADHGKIEAMLQIAIIHEDTKHKKHDYKLAVKYYVMAGYDTNVNNILTLIFQSTKEIKYKISFLIDCSLTSYIKSNRSWLNMKMIYYYNCEQELRQILIRQRILPIPIINLIGSYILSEHF